MAYTASSLPKGYMEVGVAMVLHDRFTNPARQASGAIRRLQDDARAAVSANLDMLQRLSGAMLGGAMLVGRTMSRAIFKTAPEFIDTMVSVKAISGATADEFAKMEKSAMSIGIKTMFTSNQIASGMKYLAMAGNSVKEINDIIEPATMVAGATGLQLEGKGGAADLLTNIMKTFKKEGSEAAKIVADQLTKATLSANISITDLAESIKYAAAQVTGLGVELPELAAMVGVLGNMGIQGSMAGTAIQNMARYITKSIMNPAYKGNKYLQQLGLSKADFTDAKGELLSFVDIMDKIMSRIQHLPSPDRSFLNVEIFGARGYRAAEALENNLDTFRSLVGKIQNSNGIAADVMGQRMASWAGTLNKIKSAAENLAVTFTKALVPTLVKWGNAFAKFIDKLRGFTEKHPFFAKIFALGTVLTIATSAMGLFVAAVRKLQLNPIVNMRNMIAAITRGWQGATLAAGNYSKVLRFIDAQRSLGAGATAYQAMMAAGLTTIPGVLTTGTYKRMVRDRVTGQMVPKTFVYYKDPSTGRFITETAAANKMRNVRPHQGVPVIMGGGKPTGPGWSGGFGSTAYKVARRSGLGRGAAQSLARRVAGRSAMAATTRVAGGVLSRVLGVAFGPIGIIASILLPTLISLMRKRNEDDEENTSATRENSRAIHSDIYHRTKNLTGQQEITMMYNAIRYWSDNMKNIKPTQVTIITKDGDGKQNTKTVTPTGNSTTIDLNSNDYLNNGIQ